MVDMSTADMNYDKVLLQRNEGNKLRDSGCTYDRRSVEQDQKEKCWSNYYDYLRCKDVKGEDFEPCNYFMNRYKAVCHAVRFNRFDSEAESGTLQFNHKPGKKAHH